jgi:hypothetical protein
MTQLRPIHAAVRLVDWTVLALLIACSMAEFPAAQTASASANRRRAQLMQNSVTSTANAPDPSNLGAISASVDAEVERRVNADRQNELIDPSLSPLRIIAPNVNGEDEASAQTQPGTPTPSTGGRAKYSAFTAVPQSTSIWSPGHMGRGQSAPVLRGQFPVGSLRRRPRSFHSSDRPGRMGTTSSGPTPISGVEKDLTRTRVNGSNLTGLRQARHQQEIYLRDCSKLYLSELECRAKLRQQRVSSSRHHPTGSFQKSLAVIR